MKALATGVGGSLLGGLVDGHLVLSVDTAVGFAIGVLFSVGFGRLFRALTSRTQLSPLEHAARGVPLLEVLNDIWRHEQDFLNALPEHDEYEARLSPASERIAHSLAPIGE